MGILKKIFLDRKEWWDLVPDQTIFARGGNTNGQVLNLAARHKDGQWIMAYLGSKAAFSIDMTKVKASGNRRVFWIDPRTGASRSMGSFPSRTEESFSTPSEWEDALLIVEPETWSRGGSAALSLSLIDSMVQRSLTECFRFAVLPLHPSFPK